MVRFIDDFRSLALAFIAVLSLSGMASAGTVFDLTPGFGANPSEITLSADGVELRIFDSSPESRFFNDSDGVAFLSSGSVESFTMTFSQPVVLDSYSVGYIQLLEGDESITFILNAGSSVESSPFAVGNRDFATPLTVGALEPILVVSSPGSETSGFELIQFSSLTVSVVPEPGTCLLLALPSVFYLLRRR